MLAVASDSVIAADPEFRIIYCNPSAERMYGVRASNVVGQPLSASHEYQWMNPEDEQRAFSDMRDRGFWQGEHIHVRKDGTSFIASCTVSKLSDGSGGGWVAVIRDISASKRAERELQAKAAQLARANEDLLDFAYAAGHDLTAPLRAVVSFSQLLDLKYRERMEEEDREVLTRIATAGARVDIMLRDLLQFAEVAGGETQPGTQVSLGTPLATALQNLSTVVEETRAVITCDALPLVPGHAVRLTQVFQNLIGNALKYRRPGVPPEIHVSARRSGAEWVITVRDNGMGFDPKQADSIFKVLSGCMVRK